MGQLQELSDVMQRCNEPQSSRKPKVMSHTRAFSGQISMLKSTDNPPKDYLKIKVKCRNITPVTSVLQADIK